MSRESAYFIGFPGVPCTPCWGLKGRVSLEEEVSSIFRGNPEYECVVGNIVWNIHRLFYL
jgi:hypothetical protein